MDNCIFCNIISKKTPSEIIKENDEMIIIRDIKPKAPVHLLIITKEHILSVKDVSSDDKNLLGRMILSARDIAESQGLAGYKLVFNVGREGGQLIDHLHLHLLAGGDFKHIV